MLRKLVVAVAIVIVAGGVAFWLLTIPQTVSAGALGPHQPDLANGRTMFFAGGCSGCHASEGEDKTRLGGGLALKSPFGTFYVPNISSDRRDGIGAWSEADFVTALTRGTSPDGRHYYPAFPYTSYQRMRLEDLRDLFAYLKTMPAVSGKVRDHDMAFPFGFRRGLGLWKLLYLDGGPFAPDPNKSTMLNRGAYLAEGPGHCAECHSPRNLMGGIVTAQRFAGGPNPEGKGWIPNITPKGLGDWSENDIAYLLESGQTLDGDAVGGSMAEVVRNTAQLAAEDRTAIAAYIKSLPPVEGPKPTKK
jgi:mono/diheme cytochrome c family protein